MATADPTDPADGPETWNDAPCGLLRIDSQGLVLSANADFLDRIGLDRAAVVGRLHWNELLSVGSAMFYETQLAPVLELNGSLNEVMLDLRSGTGDRLPVLINAARISDASQRSVGANIAVMTVTDRRAYETELRLARAQAERAQTAEAHARFRLELIGRANASVASSVDADEALERLARVLATELADWCVVYAHDPAAQSATSSWSAAHTDPSRHVDLDQLARLLTRHSVPRSDLGRALDGGKPVLLAHVTEDDRRASTTSDAVLSLYRNVGFASAIVVPSFVRGVRVATSVLGRGAGRPEFSGDELADLSDLATRAAVVIDNLRGRAREHDNSIALQQALLTDAPETAQVQIVTRYQPATSGNEIGGDWYDAFLQADGTPVVVIGDVVGHDIHAAAAMGQLRGVIRTLGYARATSPAAMLNETDATAKGLGVDVLASVFVGRLETGPAGPVLRWSNAGHPPPVILNASGETRLLDARPADPILGVVPGHERRDHVVDLSTGDVLFLYTDGLIERVDEDIDVGIDRLTDKVAAAHGMSLDELCDAVLADTPHGGSDDIAVLALRWLG